MNDHNGSSSLVSRIFADKPRSMLVGALFVGGLFVGGQLLVSENEDMKIPSVKVKSGHVAIKITEIGELRAQEQVTIGAITDKQIIWMVPEGQWVEEGDTLIVMESQKYTIAIGDQESNVEVKRARLAKAIGELEAHQAREEAALKNYESLPELAEKGFVMESEVEQARLVHVEFKNKTKAYAASVDEAKANVKRAKTALAQQHRKLRETVSLAPGAGLVVYATMGSQDNARKVQVGMIPFEGMDLMYLPDISTMMVDAEISEVELAKVKIGQPAEIRLDAYPDVVFKGEVGTIADLARRKVSRITNQLTGAKVFDATVKVLDKDVRLKPGLTATVDIIINEYENTLYVPLESIFLDELDRTVVYVKNGDQVEARIVVLGESNDRIAVVKEGLQEGDEVLLARPTTT